MKVRIDKFNNVWVKIDCVHYNMITTPKTFYYGCKSQTFRNQIKLKVEHLKQKLNDQSE
jgi:hypothetical protein